METFVALLRGINVGGNSLIKMSELRECFEKAGYQNVSTYINSGNVLFQADKKLTDQLEANIEQALQERFGFMPKVVVRSKAQIEQVIKHVPSSWSRDLDQKFNVIFLKGSIDSQEILNKLSIKPDIETLEYAPGVLYWSARTSDLTKSNMTKLSRSDLYQNMTVRNLNTTRKIHTLMLAYTA